MSSAGITWSAECWVLFAQQKLRRRPLAIEARILARLDRARAEKTRLRLKISEKTRESLEEVWKARYGELPIPVQPRQF